MRLLQRLGPIVLALAAGLVLVTAFVFNLVRERQAVIDATERTTQTFARVVEEHARQSLRRVGSTLAQASGLVAQTLQRSVSSSESSAILPLDAVIAGSPVALALEDQLLGLLPADRLIRSFELIDAGGRWVMGTQAGPSLGLSRLHAQQDYFLPHRRGADRDLVFGSPALGPDGQWALPISARVSLRPGRFDGVIVAWVQPGYFQSFYDSVDSGDRGFVALLLLQGFLAVRSPQQEAVGGLNWSDTTLFREHLPAWPTGTVRERDERDGVDRLYSYRALNDYPVVVAYGRSLTDELAPWTRSAVWGGSILVVAAGLLVAAGVAIVRRNLRRQQAEDALRISHRALQSISQGVVITDAHRRIVSVNQAYLRMTGYAESELLGKVSPTGMRHDPAPSPPPWMAQSLAEGREYAAELPCKRLDGSVFWCSLSITPLLDADQHLLQTIEIVQDISERRASEEQIRSLAFFDPLTNLPNRRLLMDRLQHAAVSNKRRALHGALLFIDLDNFKTLNDTRGHDVGDLLLQQVAQRLKACVREEDTLARLGGDEFVVVLESLDTQAVMAAEQARRVGDKMLGALNEAFDLDGQNHHITPSIGITLFAPGQTKLDDLMKQADLAMYAAKASGRNALRFFDPSMQANVVQRADLENELRDAVRLDQFVLFYQAQVDHRDVVLGAEALVRWRHPTRGLVSPADFIPLAEQTGLIIAIGQWVIEQSCAQLARWQTSPVTAGLTLSLNVSARQFRQPDFVAGVIAALRRHNVLANRLKLELTESLLLHDVDDVISKMSELQDFGVGFALDDFGTGYSSLAYIKRLPIEQLKIDKSFTRDLLTDSNDAVIAQAIIALAQKLQLSVMAEGVETIEQRDWLTSHGCLLYQGYLFAKPVPIEAFEASHRAVAAL